MGLSGMAIKEEGGGIPRDRKVSGNSLSECFCRVFRRTSGGVFEFYGERPAGRLLFMAGFVRAFACSLIQACFCGGFPRPLHPYGLLLSAATKVTKSAASPTVLTPFGCVVFVQLRLRLCNSRTGRTVQRGSLAYELGSAACRALAHSIVCNTGSKAY